MSAPKREKCDEAHPVGATLKSFVPEQRDGKPWEAGDAESDAEVEAEERVVDKGRG